MPTRGLRNKDEQFLQLLAETTPGVYPGSATPIICTNVKHSWSPDHVVDEFEPDGYNDLDFAAIVERKCSLEISEFVPYYNLLDEQFFQFLFDQPTGSQDASVGGVRTREYRWPQTGRRNHKTFAAEYGSPDNARRALFGFYTSWSIESQAAAQVRGKASARLQDYTENNVMAGQGARSEVQTWTLTDVPGATAVPVTCGANSGSWTPSTGASGLQGVLEGLASVGTGNVLVAGTLGAGTASGLLSGVLTITFRAAKANINMPQVTTTASGIIVTTTTQGSSTTTVPSDPVPIVPKHWRIYRADSLAQLGSAPSRISTISKFNVDIADIATEWNAHNSSDTYLDTVQQKGMRGLGMNLPTDVGDHCSLMLDNFNAYTSRAQWFRLHAVSPLAPFEFIIDLWGVINKNVPIEYNKNVEERAFGFRSAINRADGFNFRVITKVPA